MSKARADFITRSWYQCAKWLYLLFPLALLYGLITSIRKLLYTLHVSKSYRAKVPVIVVGNITVGGTGKSPLVAYLIESLRQQGFNPGVVSRGYGASINQDEVREVLASSAAAEVGDEPLMLKLRVGCPIFVSPSRRLAVQAVEAKGCDIVISDYGLQHYGLERDIEICVFDGERKWGNGCLLPVGPLRESLSRVKSIDFIVVNGESWQDQALFRSAIRMDLQGGELKSLGTGETKTISHFQAQRVNAVAAIGNPERFFQALEAQGLSIQRHGFNDHHAYSESDLDFENDLPIIMTEKDAVKCRSFKLQNAWYLPVSAKLSNDLASQIISALKHKGF